MALFNEAAGSIGGVAINDLPDSSFAWIEPGGKKDEDGKTTPRDLRHFPYKDKDGKVDIGHLDNGLSRLPTTTISAEGRAIVKKKLEAAAKANKVGKFAEGISLEQFEQGLNQKLRALLGDPWAPGGTPWSIAETYQDAVIVKQNGVLTRYPITVGGDLDADDIILGPGVEVNVEYVPEPKPAAEPTMGAPVPPMTSEPVKESKGLPTYKTLEEAVQHFTFKQGQRSAVIARISEGAAGAKWAVVILSEGISANRRFYPATTVREAAPLFENKKCYWNHAADDSAAMRDPRDIAGVFRKCRPEIIEGKTVIAAELNLITKQAREFLQECFDNGAPNAVGISITAAGRCEWIRMGEASLLRVDQVTEAISGDIVSEPAAGGRFVRLVASADAPHSLSEEKELEMFEAKLKKLKESRPDLFALLPKDPSESAIDMALRIAESQPSQRIREGFCPEEGCGKKGDTAFCPDHGTKMKTHYKDNPPEVAPGGNTDGGSDGDKMTEAVLKMMGLTSSEDVASFKANVLEGRVERFVKGRTFLTEAQDAVRATVRSLLESGASDTVVTAYVEREVATHTKIAESRIGAPGSGVGMTIEMGTDSVDKLIYAGQGLIADEDIKEGGKTYPRAKSLKNWYIAVTGDAEVTGALKESHLRRFAGVRVLEGTTRDHVLTLQEAISTGGFANVLATTLNRVLVRDYKAATSLYGDVGRGWLYTVVPSNDYRPRYRVRFGGYGNLPTVSEQGTYQALSDPTDESVNYSVAKRGGMQSLSIEAIKNDDVGFAQRIPQRLAASAARTHYEFIHNFYINNSSIYDGNNLFDATNHQGNLGSTALSKGSFSVARQTILKMQELNSNKRIGLTLKHLMVPIELAETAANMFLKVIQPGQNAANYEDDFLAKVQPQVHVIAHTTDTNDWFACVGSDQCEQIEMAYLDGREDPEIFVADLPNAGSLFFNDKIDYKIRHIYGGGVLDYRGMFGALVS